MPLPLSSPLPPAPRAQRKLPLPSSLVTNTSEEFWVLVRLILPKVAVPVKEPVTSTLPAGSTATTLACALATPCTQASEWSGLYLATNRPAPTSVVPEGFRFAVVGGLLWPM